MIFSSRLLVILTLCATSSVMAQATVRNFNNVVKDFKEAVPAVIDKAMECTNKYPHVPAMFIAAFARNTKKLLIPQKPASFIGWSLVGLLIAEPIRTYSKEYLDRKKAQELNPQKLVENVVSKVKEGKEIVEAAFKAGEISQEVKDELASTAKNSNK